VQRGANTIWLSPVNGSAPGYINVKASPAGASSTIRSCSSCPAGYKEGTVTLTGYLNPGYGGGAPSPAETTYADNQAATSVFFEAVPTVNVVFYNVGYRFSGTDYYPAAFHRAQAMTWMRRAYPVSNMQGIYRSYYHGNASRFMDSNGNWVLSSPNCDQVNATLLGKKVWDLLFDWWSTPIGSHYYGIVSDTIGFMRGCAIDIPGLVASGPTGTGTWGWDFDGSYGDWYTGHELAHTYGRSHANYCGAAGGSAYPYAGGSISPAASGNTAIYGFNIGTRDIYGPSWADVMTYCDNQWLGDFTYEGLMTYFRTQPVAAEAAASRREIDQTDRLLVTGSIDPQAGTAYLAPLYVIPGAGDVEPRTPGPYTIVLRDAGGNELARYPFTPDPMEMGAEPGGQPGKTLLAISELVPYVGGTTRVELQRSVGCSAGERSSRRRHTLGERSHARGRGGVERQPDRRKLDGRRPGW
jgi:hypothetical protein